MGEGYCDCCVKFLVVTVGVQLGSCFPFLKSGVARSIGLDKECLVVVIYVGKGQVVGMRKSIGVMLVFVGVCLCSWVYVCIGVSICLDMCVVVYFLWF